MDNEQNLNKEINDLHEAIDILRSAGHIQDDHDAIQDEHIEELRVRVVELEDRVTNLENFMCKLVEDLRDRHAVSQNLYDDEYHKKIYKERMRREEIEGYKKRYKDYRDGLDMYNNDKERMKCEEDDEMER